MGKLVYRKDEYIVIEDDYKPGHHIIINCNGRYENHGHLKYLSTCKKLIKWMKKGVVPDSPYLRGTALRVSLDMDYHNQILHKIDKDKNKPRYFNPSKGVVRK